MMEHISQHSGERTLHPDVFSNSLLTKTKQSGHESYVRPAKKLGTEQIRKPWSYSKPLAHTATAVQQATGIGWIFGGVQREPCPILLPPKSYLPSNNPLRPTHQDICVTYLQSEANWLNFSLRISVIEPRNWGNLLDNLNYLWNVGPQFQMVLGG